MTQHAPGLDPEGYPVLHLAPRSDKSGVSVQGRVKSGNPWRDPRSGTFSGGPPGMRVAGGGDLLKALSNTAKQYISNLQKRARGRAISAVQKNGQIIVSILDDSGKPITSAALPGGSAAEAGKAPAQAVTDALSQARRRDLVADLARFPGELDVDSIRKQFKNRVKGVDDAAIQKVIADAGRQRMSDVVDVLSARFSAEVKGALITVKSNGDGVQQTLNGFNEQQRREIVARVAARGASQEQAEKFVLTGLKNEEAVKTTVDKKE